jgi:pimeloyl-ACP methyl ester carboxylesterase
MKRKSSLFFLVLLLMILITAVSNEVIAQSKIKRYEPSKNSEPVSDQPYERFSTRDRFGRDITFYLSRTIASQNSLPIVLYIEGSGCGSRFEERNGKIRAAGGHIVVADVFKDKARVLIVEKPGVKYLIQPLNGNCKASADFNREHTLERWSEANEAALRAARKLPQMDKSKTLVVGHSEGGLVACRVGRDLPRIVTHVASIAGGGATQLYDLIALARRGEFFDEVSPNPQARVQFVVNKWKEIEADPMSAEKFFFGFAYRRWSSFLATSPIEELSAVRARIYLAQGTADVAVDPISADTLYAQLLAKNKQVFYDRVENANHSFRIKDKPRTDGWQELFERIGKWFAQT